jgi:hypothetical protein
VNREFKYAIGQRVVVLDAKGIEATVDRVSLGVGDVREYRVVFWHDGSRRQEWCDEAEIKAKP